MRLIIFPTDFTLHHNVIKEICKIAEKVRQHLLLTYKITDSHQQLDHLS